MDRERELLNKICNKSKDERILELEVKVIDLKLKFLDEFGRSPYAYDRVCETKQIQAKEIALLKLEIKNFLKDLKYLLVCGSRVVNFENSLIRVCDTTLLLEIYNNYLDIFGLINNEIFKDILIVGKKGYSKALLHCMESFPDFLYK